MHNTIIPWIAGLNPCGLPDCALFVCMYVHVCAGLAVNIISLLPYLCVHFDSPDDICYTAVTKIVHVSQSLRLCVRVCLCMTCKL